MRCGWASATAAHREGLANIVVDRAVESPDPVKLGGAAWVQPAPGEREALTLEAVKLAAELPLSLSTFRPT